MIGDLELVEVEAWQGGHAAVMQISVFFSVQQSLVGDVQLRDHGHLHQGREDHRVLPDSLQEPGRPCDRPGHLSEAREDINLSGEEDRGGETHED